jgi:hypothetical protein
MYLSDQSEYFLIHFENSNMLGYGNRFSVLNLELKAVTFIIRSPNIIIQNYSVLLEN